MKTVCITAERADEARQSGIEQTTNSFKIATDTLKYRVLLDHALVRAMQDISVPITDNPRDTKDLLGKIAENIGKIYALNKRYKEALKFFEHPVRVRVETFSAQEFARVVLHDKDSILSNIKNVRVGDAVDFVMHETDETRVRISRVYLDDNHNWVPAYDEPYITGWRVLADPATTFRLSETMD